MPEDNFLLTEYGYMLYNLHEYKQAEQTFQKVLNQTTNSLRAYFFLAMTYEKQNAVNNAINVYKEAFKNNSFCILFLRELYRLTNKEFYLPLIRSGQLIKKLTFDKYIAKVIGDIKSSGRIQYKYLFLLYNKDEIEPIFYVSLELNALSENNTFPEYFLCSFTESGPSNYGIFEDNVNPNNFIKKALELVEMRYKITIENVIFDE